MALLPLASAQAPRPSFEVADIRPANPDNPVPGKPRALPGGRIEVPGITARGLIAMAYGTQENMIAGAPKWTEQTRFDIVAKAPTPTQDFALFRLMLQSLLADRFQLSFHNEDRPTTVYVLTRGKRPLKLDPPSGGRQDCSWRSIEPGGDAGARPGVTRRRECHNISMTDLAQQLPGWGGTGIDLPVVNKTDLDGKFDFNLIVGLTGMLNGKVEEPPLDAGPTIFAALEQIGLKLDRQKIPVPAMVIDRIEPPSAN